MNSINSYLDTILVHRCETMKWQASVVIMTFRYCKFHWIQLTFPVLQGFQCLQVCFQLFSGNVCVSVLGHLSQLFSISVDHSSLINGGCVWLLLASVFFVHHVIPAISSCISDMLCCAIDSLKEAKVTTAERLLNDVDADTQMTQFVDLFDNLSKSCEVACCQASMFQ